MTGTLVSESLKVFILPTLLTVDSPVTSTPGVGFEFEYLCDNSEKKIKSLQGTGTLKGTVSQDFLLRFFHQSAHSGPIRDVLGPF